MVIELADDYRTLDSKVVRIVIRAAANPAKEGFVEVLCNFVQPQLLSSRRQVQDKLIDNLEQDLLLLRG